MPSAMSPEIVQKDRHPPPTACSDGGGARPPSRATDFLLPQGIIRKVRMIPPRAPSGIRLAQDTGAERDPSHIGSHPL